MKVFLSWSGETSKRVAIALNKWLPYILQPVRPWLSSEIAKGDRWGQVLETELKDTQYGIICLTKYNISKPWLNFESGVLSRFIERPCLTPLLFHIDSTDLPGPLSQFQSAVYRDDEASEDEVLKLIQSINKRLGPATIEESVVRAAFGVWWSNLKQDLDSISVNPNDETQTSYPWLYTFDDLAVHEEKKDIKAIWIITDDLAKHAVEYEIRRKLTANITRGVTYRFFIPDEAMIPTELQELRESSKGLLDYRCFRKDDFDIQAATDYILVNPHGQLQAFFRLPVEDRDDLWVEVNETSAYKFRQRFDAYWNSGKCIAQRAAPGHAEATAVRG